MSGYQSRRSSDALIRAVIPNKCRARSCIERHEQIDTPHPPPAFYVLRVTCLGANLQLEDSLVSLNLGFMSLSPCNSGSFFLRTASVCLAKRCWAAGSREGMPGTTAARFASCWLPFLVPWRSAFAVKNMPPSLLASRLDIVHVPIGGGGVGQCRFQRCVR